MAFFRCIVIALALLGAQAATEGSAAGANPVRRVVTMLQNMQKKVTAEGKRDEELFEKFMCYCKNGAGDLEKSISGADTKIPQVESAIKEAKAQKVQLEADLVAHKEDRASAKEASAKATALREKEAAAYEKESSDLKTNIASIGKAITALEKGMTGFLQTSAASVLRKLTIEMDLSNVDRDMLSSFLSTSQVEGYAPQSGQITGILKEMKDTMEKGLADSTAAEDASKTNYAGLMAAKKKEIDANTNAIEKKTARHGELAVEIVNMVEDLDDTSKALLADKQFLADMDKNCATKKDEYAVVQKTRAEELVALADTIKILNDDDALDLFKQTLPSASLLQTKVTDSQARRQAVRALKSSSDPRLDLISLALKGKSVNFDKVLKMIDEMVVLLGKEQTTDDEKKAYCEANLDKSEDELKVLDQNVEDLDHSIEEGKEAISTLADELDALAKAIKGLDKSVAESTESRKEEHKNYVDTMASDSAAKQLLDIAKNRLNKFYNPKLHKAAPKRELSEEERISVNMGGTMAPTNAPGGIAGTGVTAMAQVAPPPPPEAVGAYQAKGQESTGVIAMIDLLVADLDKEMQEIEVDEKDAQSEYETFMSDSATKRAADAASIAEKEGAKADAEASLEKDTSDKKSTVNEAMAKAEEISALHGECDWLISNFDARKEARAGEVESLKNAKAVLAGADFSFVQIARH